MGKIRPSLEGIVKVLLPTPEASDGSGGRVAREIGGTRPSGAKRSVTLGTVVVHRLLEDWREYEPAIRRWEAVLGLPAPYPAARGPRGGVKVAPAFGEWLMGLPAGWISKVPGLSINEQLKLVGNGVVPQQAEYAIRYLYDALMNAVDCTSLHYTEIESNSMTTDTSTFFGEQQSSDVPRDQWGRYLLPDADGAETGWTRATTFAATLAEQYGLSIWHQRQVVWGLARRTDLIELAATIAGPEDKKALGAIVDEAHIAAGTEAKANRGTALHKATEIGDRAIGRVDAVPPQFQRDYAAYRDALQRDGIVLMPEWIERVIIEPSYHVAGTPDRYVRCGWDGKIRVLDIKTGNLDYAQLEWSVQLALYAHAKAARNYATNSYEPVPEIADDFAIVAHIRPDSGVCELYRVDIRMGWAFARLCAEVRDARQHKALLTPLVVEPGNAFKVSEAKNIAAPVTVTTQQAMDNLSAALPAIQAAGSPIADQASTEGQSYADFWSLPTDDDTDDGLSYNGVPLAEYGKAAEPEQPAPTIDGPDPNPLDGNHDLPVAAYDAEEAAQELAKRPKTQLQQIARDLMAAVPGTSIKLTQHRIKIAREIVAAATEAGVPIPDPKGTGAHNAKPSPQPGEPKTESTTEVDTSGADKVAEARDRQWSATMFEEIRGALTVAKLQVLREQAGPKWTDAMTEAARVRVDELDAQNQAATQRVLSPAEMIAGATTRETLSKAWEVATARGTNLDGWTAALDEAAKAKMATL